MVLARAVSSRIQRRGSGCPSQTAASSQTDSMTARGTMGVSNSIRGMRRRLVGVIARIFHTSFNKLALQRTYLEKSSADVKKVGLHTYFILSPAPFPSQRRFFAVPGRTAPHSGCGRPILLPGDPYVA